MLKQYLRLKGLITSLTSGTKEQILHSTIESFSKNVKASLHVIG